MSPSVVYVKTEKGRAEIATRRNKLSSKLRAILIMVDGRRRVKDLQGEGQLDVMRALAQLEADGFIAPADAPAVPPPVYRVAEPAHISPNAPLAAARALAVRLLKEAMGTGAANFAPRLERCTTSEDLLAHAERYAILIGSVRDKDLGDRYLHSVRKALAA